MLDTVKKLGVRCARICFVYLPMAGAMLGGVSAVNAEGPIVGGAQIYVSSLPEERVDYFLYVPDSVGRSPEILVAVHGISRNAEDYASLFAPYAEEYGVIVVAPYFPREVFRDYQRLGRTGLGRRADYTLQAIIDDVRSKFPGARPAINLFGFSGGAQFAHRYAMAHPGKVNRVVIGAAGWYTFPDLAEGFPYGIRPSRRLYQTYFNPHDFLEVPMHVIVGSEDGNRSGSLNTAPQINRQQGFTRLERAYSWVSAMQETAIRKGYEPRVSLEVLPGARHSFVDSMQEHAMGDKIFDFLFGPPPQAPEAPQQFASTEAAG